MPARNSTDSERAGTARAASGKPGTKAKSRGRPSTGKVSGAQGRLPEDVPLHAVDLLEADHRSVEQLFRDFEGAAADADKRDIAIAICCALKVHAKLEEDLFYPLAAKALDDPGLIEAAYVEHASAKDLIAQIEAGAPGEALFDARVKVLGEYVAHHVAEEEGEVFPQVRSAAVDLEALGASMALRRHELSAGFVASNPVIGLANSRADANP